MKKIAWDIWFYCNYNCSYCSSKTDKIDYAGLKSTSDIIAGWKFVYDKYGVCNILITGGEPFLYPDFYNIIKQLTTYHYIHITTNLSFDISRFLDARTDKSKIFLNATFHPFFVSADEFAKNILRLKNAGYKCDVCYTSADIQIREIINYKKFFKKYNINMTPSDYYGRIYNDFIDFAVNGENIKSKNSGTPKFCHAGVEYAVVNDKGDVFTCSVKRRKLGNIYENDFAFLENASECREECRLSEYQYK